MLRCSHCGGELKPISVSIDIFKKYQWHKCIRCGNLDKISDDYLQRRRHVQY
jgi:hypothetical protein